MRIFSAYFREREGELKKLALETMGILRLTTPLEIESNDPAIAALNGWHHLLNNNPKGEEQILPLLLHDKKEQRHCAVGQSVRAAHLVFPLLKELKTASDPWVRVNLAIFLLRQRQCVAQASEVLFQFLKNTPDKLMWEEGLFATLQKSTVSRHPIIANYPEVKNQVTRLELPQLACHRRTPSRPHRHPVNFSRRVAGRSWDLPPKHFLVMSGLLTSTYC